MNGAAGCLTLNNICKESSWKYIRAWKNL